MKNILRYINSMPIRFTVYHYFPLGNAKIDLVSAEGWNSVRAAHPHFETPTDRAEWIASFREGRDGQDRGMPQRAKDIAHLVRARGFQSLHSLGVGSAALEYLVLEEQPSLKLTVSEFNAESVGRLRKVFPEGNPKQFDVLRSDWAPDVQPDHLVLIYRLDPHLSDREWRTAFERMHMAGVRNILFIPDKVLTLFNLYRELRNWVRWSLKREPLSFAGYKRTKKEFQSYWKGLYREDALSVGKNKNGFFLTRVG